MNTYALSRPSLHAAIKLPDKPRKDRPWGVSLQLGREPKAYANE
jgi:hypothetical protein